MQMQYVVVYINIRLTNALLLKLYPTRWKESKGAKQIWLMTVLQLLSMQRTPRASEGSIAPPPGRQQHPDLRFSLLK